MGRNKSEINLQKLGMRRRKREVSHMKIMTGLTVFFLTITLLFQDNMNRFQMELNYNNYGNWFMREPIDDDMEENPYVEDVGEIWSGSTIYLSDSGENEDSITIAPSDDARYTGIILGTMNKDTAERSRVTLYEGRLPEKDNEIAVELSVLRQLGLSYDLNQEISFYVAENDNVTELLNSNQDMKLNLVSFILVGTIRSYTTSWNEGSVLPSALISKDAFDNFTMNKEGYLLSGIKKEYAGNDVWIFAAELWDSICAKLELKGTDYYDEEYVFNLFAYDNPFWSNKVMYRNMTFILIILGGSIMAYLMSSYLSKRRNFYFRLREIGATVFQVWKMAGYECVYSTIGTAVLSLVLSYIVGVLIVGCVTKTSGVSFFFVFRLQTLLLIIACIVFILLVSMLIALLIFRSKRITDNKNTVSRPAMVLLKRRALKRKKRIPIKDIFSRFRICYPLSTIFSRVMGILTCVIVIMCLMQIHDRVSAYQNVRRVYHDLQTNTGYAYRTYSSGYIPVKPYVNEKGETVTKEYYGTRTEIDSMENIFSQSFLQDISELTGIKKIDYVTRDETHIFTWEGKGEAWYYQYKMDNFLQTSWNGIELKVDFSAEGGQEFAEYIDSSFYSGRYYTDYEKVWDDLSLHLDKEIADYDAFCAGEQVIVVENNVEFAYDYDMDSLGYEEIPQDDTLKPGDILTVKTKGENIEVTVAGVLSSAETMFYEYGHCAYNIVGSDKLAEKIAGEDGIRFGYNYMVADYNALADSEATGKIISRLCVQNGLSYDSGSEYISSAFNQIVQGILIYGTLAAIIFILYIFVLSCILSDERRKQSEKMDILHRIGVSEKQIARAKMKEGVKDSLYMLIAVPVSYGVIALQISEEWSPAIIGGYSFFFHKEIFLNTKGEYIFYSLFDRVNMLWMACFIIITLAVVLFLRHRNCKKMWER